MQSFIRKKSRKRVQWKEITETGNKHVELIIEPGFMLRGKKLWQSRHNGTCCFSGLVKGHLYLEFGKNIWLN